MRVQEEIGDGAWIDIVLGSIDLCKDDIYVDIMQLCDMVGVRVYPITFASL